MSQPSLLAESHLSQVTKYLEQLSNQEVINVGVELGLNFTKLKNKSSEVLLSEMVHAWLRRDDDVMTKSGSPSWESLCRALEACGHNGIALNIKEEQTSSKDAQATSSGAETQNLPDTGDSHVGASLPLPHPEEEMDPNIKMDLEYILRKNLKQITAKYAAYVDTLRRAVIAKGVTTEDLRAYLLAISASSTDLNLTLLADHKEELNKCLSVTEIFNFLTTNYASFLNYDIFQFVLKYYSIGEDEENLKYAKHLNDYLQQHNVSEFMKVNPRLKTKKGFKEVNLKLDVKTMCKLSKISDIKQVLAEILNITPSALHIVDIKDDCIIVTFCIPRCLADELFTSGTVFTTKQSEALQKASILWLECNGNTFYFKESLESYFSRYLEPLNNQEVINVGEELGLSRDRLKNMNPKSLLNDMVHAWLRGDDDVMTKSLCRALEACGHDGIASKIEGKTLTPKGATERGITRRDVYQYLKGFTRPELIDIGLKLGLSYSTLLRMSPESLLNDMVHAWLRKYDDVMEISGDPSWESLSTALESCGYNRIASEIREQHQTFQHEPQRLTPSSQRTPPTLVQLHQTPHQQLTSSSQRTPPTLVQDYHYGLLMEQLVPCQAHWERIAIGLRFYPQEIKSIKVNPVIVAGGPEACLREVLGQWLTWAEGDARGSQGRATLEALKTALDRAGFPKVANSLTLKQYL